MGTSDAEAAVGFRSYDHYRAFLAANALRKPA
jgi:hypothetical protein